MKHIPAPGTAKKKRVRRSNAKAPGIDENMGTDGTSLVFDIPFSETGKSHICPRVSPPGFFSSSASAITLDGQLCSQHGTQCGTLVTLSNQAAVPFRIRSIAVTLQFKPRTGLRQNQIGKKQNGYKSVGEAYRQANENGRRAQVSQAATARRGPARPHFRHQLCGGEDRRPAGVGPARQRASYPTPSHPCSMPGHVVP